MKGGGSTFDVFHLGELLQPTHRLLSLEVLECTIDTAIKPSVSWLCGAVQVNVNCEEDTALVQGLALVGLLAPAPLVLLAVGFVPAPHHLQPCLPHCHTPCTYRELAELGGQIQGGDD